MQPNQDTDFELDLDKVFSRSTGGAGSVSSEQSVTSQSPASRSQSVRRKRDTVVAPVNADIFDEEEDLGRLPEAPRPLPQPRPGTEPAHVESTGPLLGGRRQFKEGKEGKGPLDGFGRKFHRPSALIAARAAMDSLPLDDNATTRESAVLRERGELPEFVANKAHSVLADFDMDLEQGKTPGDITRPLKILGVLALLGALGYVSWLYIDRFARQDTASTATKALEFRQDVDRRTGEARRVLEEYFAAADLNGKSRLIVDAGRVRPLMDKYYLDGGVDPAVVPATAVPLKPRQLSDKVWFPFQVKQVRGGVPLIIQIQETTDGRYLFDWESFANVGSTSWKKFLEDRPKTPTPANVQMQLASVYSPPYLEAEYLCFELSSPSGPTQVYGYARRSERVSQTLQGILKKSPEGAAVNLYLHFESDASPQQVRISELVEEWTPLEK